MWIKRKPTPGNTRKLSASPKSPKSPPGFRQLPASTNALPCSANQPFSYNVCLYSVFKTTAPVPLSMVLPTPLIFKLLSTENGAKGVSSLLDNPNLTRVAQFPLCPTLL